LSVSTEGINLDELVEVLVAWGKANFRDYPWRKTSNRFHALIAEIMLQRTKADQVLPVYEAFTRKYSSPKDVCLDSPEKVTEILKPLGLSWRARKILDLSVQASNREISDSYKELIDLSCVGQYAASAFLSLHSNQRFPLIDANTVRVWGRVFGFQTNAETRRKKWFKELVETLTPQKSFKEFNYSILDFSSLICKPKPLCYKCPINRQCRYYNNYVIGKPL
jgi:A/G-specific adenine glycosylase